MQEILSRELYNKPSKIHYRINLNRVNRIDLYKYLKPTNPFLKSSCTAFTLDSNQQYILSAYGDERIDIHDTLNDFENVGGKEKVHESRVTSVDWYPFDTGLFTTASIDGKLKVWDTNTMETVYSFNFKEPVLNHSIAIQGIRPLIATGTVSKPVRLVDLNSGSMTHSLFGHQDGVTNLIWCPNREHTLISASKDGHVIVWDIRKTNAKLIDMIHSNQRKYDVKLTTLGSELCVNGILLSSNGSELFSIGKDRQMKKWNIFNGLQYPYRIAEAGGSKQWDSIQLGIVKDLKTPLILIPTDKGTINLYDTSDGHLFSQLKGHMGRVNGTMVKQDTLEVFSSGVSEGLFCWKPQEDTEVKHEMDDWSD
ncbi:WD40-repeat-containing domain protein [Globomyces pollinis-pini]|nr:WD40-repeat-containing domain protein [Globomyces pollinis-pini]